MAERKWLAVYTKPRWEKKIYLVLEEMKIESYCPLNKVHRKWSDRIKLVEEPLFKSYVFVLVNDEEVKQVRVVNGVLNFVYWLGRPAVIKQKEIDKIKRFLNEYTDVEAMAKDFKVNDQVLVTAGALMDQRGKILRKVGSRVELMIESLGYKLVAYVDKNKVSKIY